jgi:beta-lactamase regulating signal transducer with metallopeptidase domain/protocatechuate 3,4-dioxygenase beta subunit
MNEIINTCVTGINNVGRGFCTFAGGMFVQSAVLIAILLVADWLLRKRVKATFRYWIWMLVFIKLVLPPSLSSPTSLGYWYHDWLAAGRPIPLTVVAIPVQKPTEPEAQTSVRAESTTLTKPVQPPESQPVQVTEPVGWASAHAESATKGYRVTLTGQGALFLLWLVGVLVLVMLVIQRVCFVRGLAAQSTPAGEPLTDLLDQCRDQMNVRRSIGLRLSPTTFSPAVCGLFRPVILLPAALLQKLSNDDLRAVLIHELAHVKRGDLWLNSIQTLLQIAYFYSPFVWLASAITRRVREQAVDEMVLVALGAEAKSYSRTLVDIAEMAFFKPHWALRLVGVAESKKALEGRIKHMLTRPIPKSARIGVRDAVAVLLIAAALLPMARAERSGKDVPSAPPATGAAMSEKGVGESVQSPASSQTLDFRVVSAQTKAPIADVNLEIRVGDETKKQVTDAEGRCRIEHNPLRPEYTRVTASKPGLVPIQVVWSGGSRPAAIPREYVLAMEPATTIGGIVRNKDGKPIEGATLHLLVSSRNESGGERVTIPDLVEKTDTQGRWRCDLVPAKFDRVQILLQHPDYMSDDVYGRTPMPPADQLRALTGVMVMNKGTTVAGRVLDMNDRPIEKASVVQAAVGIPTGHLNAETDSQGRFEIKNARPGRMALVVRVKGYSPDLKQFTVGNDMEPIVFKLERGHTLQGRVVDKAGMPIAGAVVRADSWRDSNSSIWQAATDSDGRFRWEDAPADQVLFYIGKSHYSSLVRYAMTASDQEQTITLNPQLTIKGRVTDEATGQPIPTFTVVPGRSQVNGQSFTQSIGWFRPNARSFTDGVYEYTFPTLYPEQAIRVEADDYTPQQSRLFKDGEGEVVWDLSLKKGARLSGSVRLPDGGVAVGVDVLLCRFSGMVVIENGRASHPIDSVSVQTSTDGRFSFPVQVDPYFLVLVHDKGFAQVTAEDFARSPGVTLTAWGRVEGKVMVGAKPDANEGVQVAFNAPMQLRGPRVRFQCSAVTDKDGHFAIDHVPPGKAQVAREVKTNQADARIPTALSYGVPIGVKPGETVSVTIGGTGRPVIGKIANFDSIKNNVDGQRLQCYVMPRFGGSSSQMLPVKYEPDGTFRVEDVPAGDYVLYSNSGGSFMGGRGGSGAPDGGSTYSFTVPDVPGGRSGEPLDLGVVDLTPPNNAVGLWPSRVQSIQGIVVDPNDRPVSSATVFASGLSFREATTDAKGAFELRSMSPLGAIVPRVLTPYIVVQDKGRNLAAAVSFDSASTEPLRIKLTPGAILSGRVTDAQDKGLPAAQISLALRTGQTQLGLRESSRSDPNGRYEIQVVPAGHSYSISATAEGYGENSTDVQITDVAKGRIEADPIVLVVANLDVSGVVVDADDKPVANAEVLCSGPGQRPQRSTTDSQGRFVIHGLGAGVVRVQADMFRQFGTARGGGPPVGSIQTDAGATGVKIVIGQRVSGMATMPAKPQSLTGKALPSIADLGIEAAADSYKDQRILLCFFDAGRRPSRDAVSALAKQANQLKQKSVTVIAVRTDQADTDELKQWLKEQSAVSIGSMKDSTPRATSSWGVQTLPWLILTDKNHVVQAEGFSIDDLDKTLQSGK